MELRVWTDELCELHKWRVLGTKALGTVCEELKTMEGLRATKAAALDEVEKL